MNEYRTYDELPEWVKTELHAIFPGGARAVVNEPVPALGKKSILEIMSLPNGHAIIRNYFNRLGGKMLN